MSLPEQEQRGDRVRRLFRSPYTWVALAYLATLAAMPSGGLWINDNGLKLLQAETLLDSSFRDWSLAWPGETLDPGHRFQPVPAPLGIVREGQLFASYPPAFAALTALPLALFGSAGLWLLPLAGALALLPAVRRLADDLDGRPGGGAAGRVAVLLTALASPVWFYAFTLWEHTAALALSTWCLLAAVRFLRAPSLSRALAVGGLAAAGPWLRTDGYLLAAIVTALCLFAGRAGGRSRPALLIALASGLVPLWIFQGAVLGHPLGLHLQSQQWETLTPAVFLQSRLTVATNLLLNCHPRAWLSAAVAGAFWLALAWRPRLESRRAGALLIGAAVVAVAAAAVVASGIALHERQMLGLVRSNGLFAAAPLAVFSFFRVPRGSDETRAVAVSSWVVLLALVGVYAGLAPEVNSTGLHWGCRFLLTAYPILAALSARVLVQAWRRRTGAVRAALVAAVAAALGLQLLGLGLLRQRKAFNARVNREVHAAAPRAIVTDVWFLPATLAPNFHRHPIFLVRGPLGLREILRRLEGSGTDEALLIAGDEAGSAGVEGATLLSDGALGLATLRMGPVRTGRGLSGAGGGS